MNDELSSLSLNQKNNSYKLKKMEENDGGTQTKDNDLLKIGVDVISK